jgi:hypothetical protein
MRPSTNHARIGPIVFAAALLGWTVTLAPHHSYPRDVAVRDPIVAPLQRPTPLSLPQRGSRQPTRGSDVVVESYPLRAATLTTWRANDRVQLPDPDGGTVDLRVDRVVLDARARHLMLLHDALVSTFTQSDGHYFGTLATAHGVYALDGDDRMARLTRHALLDQRMVRDVPDYSPPPAR